MAEVQTLGSSYQQAWGAMFRRSLGDQILAFPYPFRAPRLFHTFFCRLCGSSPLTTAAR